VFYLSGIVYRSQYLVVFVQILLGSLGLWITMVLIRFLLMKVSIVYSFVLNFHVDVWLSFFVKSKNGAVRVAKELYEY